MKKHNISITTIAASVFIALSGVPSGALAQAHARAASTPPSGTIVLTPGPNGDWQDNFNPFSANANYGTLGLVYEPLFYFDSLSGHTFPLLGKSYTWSNGNKTLTVNLQNKAAWSDGTPFTSADVVFTFDLLKRYPAIDTNAVWTKLSSVKADGASKVVFQFQQADVPFAMYVLNDPIVPKHIWSKLGDPTKANITKPVGTGPYVLANFTAQDYRFNANMHYYGGIPPVKTVDYPAYAGNDSVNMALAMGKIDWAGNFIPNIQKIYVNRDSVHNHYWFAHGSVIMLYTNLKDPLLSQLPVRQAISLAINRNKIANEAEYGYTVPANPLGLVLPNNQAWIDPKLKSQLNFGYDPAKAIQILERAGFKKNSKGIFEKNGKPLSFTLQVVAGWTDWDTSCALIESDLKKIGIQVSVIQEQYGAYAANLNAPIGKKPYQLAISWTNAGPTPYYLYENMLATGGNYNVEQLNNSTVNAALLAYSRTTNLAQQKQAMYKVENYMATKLPSVPLFYGPVWDEYRTAKFTGFPTQAHPWISGGPASNFAQAIVLMHLHPLK